MSHIQAEKTATAAAGKAKKPESGQILEQTHLQAQLPRRQLNYCDLELRAISRERTAMRERERELFSPYCHPTTDYRQTMATATEAVNENVRASEREDIKLNGQHTNHRID